MTSCVEGALVKGESVVHVGHISKCTGSSHAPLAGIADPKGFRKAFIEAQDEGMAAA